MASRVPLGTLPATGQASRVMRWPALAIKRLEAT